MKCKIDSVNMVDMSARFVTKAGGGIVVPISEIQAETLLGYLSSHNVPMIEVVYQGGDEFSLAPCEEVSGSSQSGEIPDQRKPLTRKQLSALGSRLSSLSAILVSRGILSEETTTLRRSSIVSTIVMPALERAGILTAQHERVDAKGEKRKVRYFTWAGGEYGFTKKMLKDISGKDTISRNHVFYSHKSDELIELLGADLIEKIKQTCR